MVDESSVGRPAMPENQCLNPGNAGSTQRRSGRFGLMGRKETGEQSLRNMTDNERDNRQLDAAERGSTHNQEQETAILGKLE